MWGCTAFRKQVAVLSMGMPSFFGGFGVHRPRLNHCVLNGVSGAQKQKVCNFRIAMCRRLTTGIAKHSLSNFPFVHQTYHGAPAIRSDLIGATIQVRLRAGVSLGTAIYCFVTSLSQFGTNRRTTHGPFSEPLQASNMRGLILSWYIWLLSARSSDHGAGIDVRERLGSSL